MIKLTNLIKEMYFSGFMPSKADSKFPRPENFDVYEQTGKWSAWRGGNDWENGNTYAAVYFGERDDSHARVWFEIKYPPQLEPQVGEAIDYKSDTARAIKEWGKKATRRWITTARRIRYENREKINPENFRYYYKKDWKECFVEALSHPRMTPFVKECGVDYTKWHTMRQQEEEPQPAGPEKHPLSENILDDLNKEIYEDDVSFIRRWKDESVPNIQSMLEKMNEALTLNKRLTIKGNIVSSIYKKQRLWIEDKIKYLTHILKSKND